MERRGTNLDYDEFEMLLGEINVTSGSPHTEESLPISSSPNAKRLPHKEENGKMSSPTSFTNPYRSSQVTSPNKNATLYSGLSYEIPSTASANSYQRKLEMNGTIEGRMVMNMKSNHHSPVKNIGGKDGSNISEDQSLESALTQLNLEDEVASEPRSPSLVNSNSPQNRSYISEGQYRNCLKESMSSLSSGNRIISSPPSPHTLNGMTILPPTTNSLDYFNLEINGQRRLDHEGQELKEQHVSRHPLEKLSGGLGEQQSSPPAYSGAVPLAPNGQTFQVLSNVPVNGLEFTPYQQQYLLEAQSLNSYMQAQELNQTHITWRHIEEERYCRIHQQYLYLQRIQSQVPGAQNLIQENGNATMRLTTRSERQPYCETHIPHHLEQPNKLQYLDNSGTQTRFNHYNHSSHSLSIKDFEAVQILDKVGKHTFPEKILTRSHGLNSLRSINPDAMGDHESCANHINSNGKVHGNGHAHHHPSIFNAESFQLRSSCVDGLDLRHSNSRSQPQKYNSVDEVVGRIYVMAKDQHGCRFLQRKLTEGNAEDARKIFFEIIDHIVELMTDPFGNYLVQKLLEVCNEDQRMQILNTITQKPGELVRISSDMHGTRSVQKVIETLKTSEQFSAVVSSLKPGIMNLMKDMNGNHVPQRCFQYFLPKYTEFLYDAITAHFVELATDRHGCVVLQKCLSHSDSERRRHLIYEITSNALILSQDPFGNYVVQYVFELRVLWAISKVLDQLDGNYGYLSMQKYSSNVVEKCLQYAGEERRPRIIQELIKSSRLDQISQHPFGNYVVQAALNHSKGSLHAALVEALDPHIPALRTSPFGKKVLSCISLKK